MSRFFGGVAAATARRPWPVLILAVLLGAISIWAAGGMGSQNVTDAFFDKGSSAYRQTEQADRYFGTDPVVIMAKGPLIETLDTYNLNRLATLETCLAGRIKRGRGQLFRTCKEISDLHPVHTLAGPATFLGRAVAGITEVYNRQIERLSSLPDTPAGQAERSRLIALAAQVISKYGLVEAPTLEDPTFVRRVVFSEGGVRAGPKPKLNYIFPSPDAAQIVIRLRSDLTGAERTRAIGLIKEAASDPSIVLRRSQLVVSGSPVVFNGLNDELPVRVLILAAVAVLLMSLALWFTFGSIWRLLPLALALGGMAVAAGLLRLLGGEFSLASLGAAPILIGLTVDYAVQLQARFDEEPRPTGGRSGARRAAESAKHQRIDSALAQTIRTAQAGGRTEAVESARARGLAVADEQIRTIVETTDGGLAHGRGVHVIVDGAREAGGFADRAREGHVAPAIEHDRRAHDAAGEVAEAWDADADGSRCRALRAKAPDERRDASDDVAGRGGAPGRLARLPDHDAAIIDDAGEELARADVHAEGQHAACSASASITTALDRSGCAAIASIAPPTSSSEICGTISTLATAAGRTKCSARPRTRRISAMRAHAARSRLRAIGRLEGLHLDSPWKMIDRRVAVAPSTRGVLPPGEVL